jgi:starch phosphorylase
MEPGVFQPLVDNLLRSDYYMLLADLQDYADTQAKVERLYADSRQWNRKALLNVCRAGRFSSDRTIGEYAKEIWHLPPYEVD